MDTSDLTQGGAEMAAAHRSSLGRSAEGRLDLLFRAAAGRPTQMQIALQQPPLRVVRTFPLADGAALVHLHNVSGGVLGGDQMRIDVRVAAHARVQMTTTGATRIYQHRAGMEDASQESHFHVGADALLESLPDAVIPYAGARYRQATRYELEDGAGLFAWEIISPGREAHGEVFAYDRLELETAITSEGAPLALERMQLMPAAAPLTSPVRLGRYRYFATFYACRIGLPASLWPELEVRMAELAARFSHPGEVVWGASILPAHGLVVRGLSLTHRRIATALPLFWGLAKRLLYGMEAVPPRKLP